MKILHWHWSDYCLINPESTVHYFAENKLIQQYNEIQLDKITSELVRIQTIDEVMKFKLVDP